MDKLLIFDLDDTIFETRTIKKKSAQKILEKFSSVAIKKYGKDLTNQIISEFWKYPFDLVSEKYSFDNQLKKEFVENINETEFKLNIRPFEDFRVVRAIESEKILVTTGFGKLQRAKIDHLGIKNDFSEIHIDEILGPNRKFKDGIFLQILSKRNIDKNNVFVIGDNSESELKAGFELGLTTVQVSKLGQVKSEYANHTISDFSELIEILN